MTQLFFDTPDFEPVTADEHPKLVFAFGSRPSSRSTRSRRARSRHRSRARRTSGPSG